MSDFSSAIRARSKSMSIVGLREPLFGALLRRLGARDVDLVGRLGDLREDRHAVGLHFGEAERDRQVVLLLALAGTTARPTCSSASSGVCPGRTPK